MNTIELIRAEVERRKTKLHSTIFNDEYNDLLSFLDTLEEKSEKPINLDFEKEISKYINERWKFGCINPITPVYLYDFTLDELKECARHFYELGRNAK